MNKTECFKDEIDYIKNQRIKESCLVMVDLLPDYFFEIPASSTEKYHPKYAIGQGGLLRHVKAAVRIAHELLGDPCIGDKYTKDEADLMLMALILHDGLKSGLDHSKYTQFDHPILMANYIMENRDKLQLDEKELEFVTSAIKTHMGPWTADYRGNEILERPKTKYQNFVHMCDYLASRKCILFSFDHDNHIID